MRLSSNLRRYRWAVFTAWLLVLLPAVLIGLHESNNLTGGGFEVAGSQSLQVQEQLEKHYPDQGASPLALVAAPRPGATVDDMTAAVDLLEQKVAEVPSVSLAPNPPAQPPPGPERPYVVSLKLGFNNSGAVDVAKQLRSKVGINGDKPGQLDNGKVDLYVIGQGALGAAAQEKTRHDIGEAEQWGLPIILIVLLAVFGSLAAAAMPLILGVLTVVVSMGVVFLLSMFTTMSVFVTPTVSMFGIALAVDYSLFILMRYREELRAGRDAKQATDAAMATSGLAVVLSGLTVIASLAGIYLINTPVLRSMATGAVVTVAVAVLTSVTLIPAILATFGRAAAKRSWLLHWSRPAGIHPVAVLDALDRVGDAPSVGVCAGSVRAAVDAGRTRAVDDAVEQHAAPVRTRARDARRSQRGHAGAGAGRARPGPSAGDIPRRQRDGSVEHAGRRCRGCSDARGAEHRDRAAPGIGRRRPQRAAVGRARGGSRGHGRPRHDRLDA